MQRSRRALHGGLLLLALAASPLVAQRDSTLRSTLARIARTSGGQLGVGVALECNFETGPRRAVVYIGIVTLPNGQHMAIAYDAMSSVP